MRRQFLVRSASFPTSTSRCMEQPQPYAIEKSECNAAKRSVGKVHFSSVMKALRILHCIPTASGGGTESTLTHLLRYRPAGPFLHRIFVNAGKSCAPKLQASSSSDLKICFQEGL